jgi:hypothetical protein
LEKGAILLLDHETVDIASRISTQNFGSGCCASCATVLLAVTQGDRYLDKGAAGGAAFAWTKVGFE